MTEQEIRKKYGLPKTKPLVYWNGVTSEFEDVLDIRVEETYEDWAILRIALADKEITIHSMYFRDMQGWKEGRPNHKCGEWTWNNDRKTEEWFK